MNTRKSGSNTRRTTSSRAKKPTTIDLEAKKPAPAKGDAKASPDQSNAKPAYSAKTASTASKTASTGTASKSSGSSAAEKSGTPLGRAAAKPAEKPEAKAKPEPAKPAEKQASGNKTGFVPMVVSGLVGGVSVAALLAGLQIGGVLDVPNNGSSQSGTGEVTAEQHEALKAQVEALSTASDDGRFAALENAISELGATPQGTDQALIEQIGALEAEFTGLKSILDNLATSEGGEVPDATQLSAALAQAGQRIDKLETTLSDMLASGNEGLAETDQRLGELSKKLDEIANGSEDKITPLTESVAQISSSIEALRGDVTKNTEHFEKLQSDSSQLQQSIASVKASEKVAKSVAVNALGAALKNDDSLVLAIASLESLGGKSAETQRLSELASEGVPSLSALLSGLETLTNTVQNPVQTVDGGTLTEKFWANARNLVTFRSSGPQEGDSAIAILSRVKSGVELGQLENALAQWKLLPIEVQASGKDWSAMLEKRIEAFSLYQQLSDNLQNEAS